MFFTGIGNELVILAFPIGDILYTSVRDLLILRRYFITFLCRLRLEHVHTLTDIWFFCSQHKGKTTKTITNKKNESSRDCLELFMVSLKAWRNILVHQWRKTSCSFVWLLFRVMSSTPPTDFLTHQIRFFFTMSHLFCAIIWNGDRSTLLQGSRSRYDALSREYVIPQWNRPAQ